MKDIRLADKFYKLVSNDARLYFGRDIFVNPYEDFSRQWLESGAKTEQEYIEFYRNSNYIDELVHWHTHSKIFSARKVIRILLDYLPEKSSILDFGGGIGSDSLAWDFFGYKVYYYEINKRCIDFMRFRMKSLETQIEIIKDIKIVNSYDAVVMFDVIAHLKDPFMTLNEISEKTNMLIFTVDLGVHDERKAGQPQHSDFSRNTIYKHLENLGFRKIKIEGMAFPPQVWKK
jgi:hypothetical protein